MAKQINQTAFASHPGNFRLSNARLRALRPDLVGLHGVVRLIVCLLLPIKCLPQKRMIRRHLQIGDSRAAVVISIDPLLIAAYTDELDCVAMLKFDGWLVSKYGLKPGTRLLTVNTYWHADGQYSIDLTPGPLALERWYRFSPMIADFLTNDLDQLIARKSQIDEREWKRAADLGADYLTKRLGQYRDGRPGFSLVAARPPTLKNETRRM